MPASKEVQARSKEQRRRVHALRVEGVSFEEIARIENVTEENARKLYSRALKLEGLPRVEELIHGCDNLVKQDAQKLGNAIGDLIVAEGEMRVTVPDPVKFTELHAACKAAGLRPSVISGLIKRLHTNLAPVMEEGKRLTVAELTKELDKKISMVLGYVDEYAAGQASLKDLSIALSVMIEKRELLNNRPTQIIDMTSRMKVHALLPLMMREAQRRGITVDGTATVVESGGVA